MRNISAASLELIKNKTGLQPINFITVQWVNFGSTYYYSDRRITGTDFEPRILELGNIENIVKVSDNSRSQSVSVKLDDTDGELKKIIDQVDIHKRQIYVYQWFVKGNEQVISLGEAFVIFQGQINSPIVWKEGDRTLSFEIVEIVEDKEIGFSVEEGQFDFVPEELVGKPFPLGFGTCVRIPVLKINTVPTGLTRHPIGFADPTLKPKMNQNAAKIRNLLAAQYIDALYAGECAFAAYLIESDIDDLQKYLDRVITYDQLLSNHNERASQTPNITGGGVTAPVAQYGVPKVGESKDPEPEEDAYTLPWTTQIGTVQDFTNTGMNYVGGTLDKATLFNEPEPIDPEPIKAAISNLSGQIGQIKSLQKTYEQKSAQEGAQAAQIKKDNTDLAQHLRGQLDVGQVTSVIDGQKFPRGLIKVKINEAELTGSFADDVFHPDPDSVILNPQDKRNPERKPPIDEHIEKGKFTIINPGATVTLISDYPIHFIVNLLPSTVSEVLAKRSGSNGGASVMTPVPPSYYVVHQMAFGIYNTTVVTLNRALSTYDEGWEDQIYVTFTSSIGPNTIDILIWLITTYTTHPYDIVSFTLTRAKLSQYPSNFVLFDRKNILTILEELAFQARLGLWLDSGIFKVKYLPESEFPVDEISESDIEFGTLEVEHSQTEELITKFVARYKYHYEDKNPNLIVLRYNINKYGTLSKEYDYYAYNISSCVYISAVFWLIRKANTWKRIKFKTPLHKLNLETFDPIILNFNNPYVSYLPVVGIVDSAKYDSENWSIEFEVWTPVRIGEMWPYWFAWPANVSSFFSFPTNEEITDGSVGTQPNSGVGGILPGADTSFGNPTFVNMPPDVPRIKGQGNRPRDYGPKNVSDQRGGPFQISNIPTNLGTFASPLSNAQPYEYRNYGVPTVSPPPKPDADSLNTRTIPIPVPLQILSGTGDTYQAWAIPTGRSKDKEEVTVRVLEIDPTETIPPGTWLIGFRVNGKYYAQPPVFLTT